MKRPIHNRPTNNIYLDVSTVTQHLGEGEIIHLEPFLQCRMDVGALRSVDAESISTLHIREQERQCKKPDSGVQFRPDSGQTTCKTIRRIGYIFFFFLCI